MPCYEVRLVSVEFKAQHKDLLIQALNEVGLEFRVSENRIVVAGEIKIDLDRQEVRCPEVLRGTVNEIKRKYSEVVLKKVAGKKRWSVKNTGTNKFQLRKWA
jgi:hypothetical protein